MIELSERDGVALLRLADGKANAMSLDFCEALTARFAALSSARAVVLTGTGTIFSAGVDLVRLLEGGAPYIRKFLPTLSTMLVTVFSHPAPVIAAINGHAIAGRVCARVRCRQARNGRQWQPHRSDRAPRRSSVSARCHRDHALRTAPQFFAQAIFGGATYSPIVAIGRCCVHDLLESEALLDRALDAASALAALPAKAFALSKRQTREPALERMQNREVDAAIEQIWTAPETLQRVRDYVARTLRK